MPKLYWRCPKCHFYICRVMGKEISITIIKCFNCGAKNVDGYKCHCYYWWERLYLSIREIIRNLKRRKTYCNCKEVKMIKLSHQKGNYIKCKKCNKEWIESKVQK